MPELSRLGRMDFPPEWIGLSRFAAVEVIATADLDGDGKAILAQALLADGSNLMGLCYPGGQGMLRIEPLGTLVEIKLDGARPSSDPTVDKLWGIAVESMHGALAETRKELGL